MTTSMHSGLRLEFPDDQADIFRLEDINVALAPFGSQVWSLDLRSAPETIRQLLGTAVLNDDEISQVMDYFMLPREALTAKFEEAGRTLQVPGGG